jgi:antitoxin (DNA-binding transcriptional repressor) of toxin-antitoxin stability system
MTAHMLSKSPLKSQLLKTLRMVEKERKPLLITHGGKPVVRILPYPADPQQSLKALRGSVITYSAPTQPAGEDD